MFLLNNAQYNHGRRWLGPYEVLNQSKNDVTIRSLLDTDITQTVHVDRLQAYHGERDKAVDVSRIEQKEHAIKEIVQYYGNPMDRDTLGFQVEFEDGTVVDKTYNDIKKTVALNNFIQDNKELGGERMNLDSLTLLNLPKDYFVFQQLQLQRRDFSPMQV